MPEQNVPTSRSNTEVLPADFAERSKQREIVANSIIEQIKPWLFEFGTWIFGGLIAFTLVIIATLMTLGPVHPAIMVSITIFACALPLDVSSLFLLRLVKDMNNLAFDDIIKQAFQDASVQDVEAFIPSADEKQKQDKRRTDLGLRYSLMLVAVSVTLTIIGMGAELWYMAWWIATIFFIMVTVSVILSTVAVSHLMPQNRRPKRN